MMKPGGKKEPENNVAERKANPRTAYPCKGAKMKVENVERKRAEERFISSECKFRAIFENANDAIFLVREDTFIDCNRKTVEIFGC